MSSSKFTTNEHFDGKVISVAFQTSTLPSTAGVISIAEYEFGTSQHENISVISRAISVTLPNTP